MADADEWAGIIRQVTLGGFLQKKTEEFGVLSLTEKGEEYLAKTYRLHLVSAQAYAGDHGQ